MSDASAPVSEPTWHALLHVASLTNKELFTIVIASIKRSEFFRKSEISNKTPWQSMVARVAIQVAEGDHHCCTDDDWITAYQKLQLQEHKTISIKEALSSLSSNHCYTKRLTNVFQAMASLPSQINPPSIRSIAGLIRISTYLSPEDENTVLLQGRAISCLVQQMPQLASSNPFDIFFAVQLPILQKLNWKSFVNGGIVFPTLESQIKFNYFLGRPSTVDDGDNPPVSGTKRKRSHEHASLAGSDMLTYFLQAADCARKGIVRAQHGAVIFLPNINKNNNNNSNDDSTAHTIIGQGWNHDYYLSVKQKNKIVLHSEVHAVVDAIHNYGEEECFTHLFPQATIVIVELFSEHAYDTCHPCPKCDPLLRAVGIKKVVHATPHGWNSELDLSGGEGSKHLLGLEVVAVPLKAACQERQIHCVRLEQWEERRGTSLEK